MKQVLDCFDRAFVINADNQKTRLEQISKRLSSVGVEFERFPAVTPGGERDRLRDREGCVVLSHRKVVELSKERGFENVLIFEDDAVFRPDFVPRWRAIVQQVRCITFDLLYFYDWSSPTQSGEPQSLIRIAGTLCSHAYAVSARYYDSYIETTNREIGLGAIDRILLNVPAQKWAIIPNLVGQDAGISTVYNLRFNLRWSSRDG